MAGTAVTSTASTTHSQIVGGFVHFKVWVQFWYRRGNSNEYIVPRIIWGLRNFLLDGTIPRRTWTNIYSLQIGDQWSSGNTTNVQPDEVVSLLELAYKRWVRGNLQEQKWLKGHCIKESPSHSGGMANKSRKHRAHCTARGQLCMLDSTFRQLIGALPIPSNTYNWRLSLLLDRHGDGGS